MNTYSVVQLTNGSFLALAGTLTHCDDYDVIDTNLTKAEADELAFQYSEDEQLEDDEY